MTDKAGKIALEIGGVGAVLGISLVGIPPAAMAAGAIAVAAGAGVAVTAIGVGIHNYLSEADKDNNHVNVLSKGNDSK